MRRNTFMTEQTPSTYTIDRKSGEKMIGDLDYHVEGLYGRIHQATWSGVRWTWNNREADK